MASVNKAIILGNLGGNPEISQTKTRIVARMSVATTRRYRSTQTGELVSDTEWHRVVAFDRTAEVIRDFLHKGNPVYVEGRLRTRKWQDQNGQERHTTEIVCENLQLLGSREAAKSAGAPVQTSAPYDEDVPF